jgi:hypothetical protein
MQRKGSQKKHKQYQYRHFNREAFLTRSQVLRKPLQHEVDGELRLGFVNKNVVFCINSKEITQHMLIIGRSGAGKTTILRLLAYELKRLNIPFLAFDLSKYGLRNLKSEIPAIVILRSDKEFFFNFLKPPPGVKLKEWMLTVCEVLSEIYGLKTASKIFLMKVMSDLYFIEFNSEKTGRYPTLNDLYIKFDNLLNDKKTKAAYKDYVARIYNKLYSMKLALGDTVYVEHGIPLEEILKYPACIEMVSVNSSEVRMCIVSMIMAWISSYRQANAQFGAKLRGVFFFDEAASVFGKGQNDQESYLIGCVRRLRESGQGIVFLDQSVKSLKEQVKSNIYTIICLSQSSVKDMNEAASMIGLPGQMSGILNHLNVGTGIVKLLGRYTIPTTVQFPNYEPAYIKEEDLDKFNSNDQTIQNWLWRVKFRYPGEEKVETIQVVKQEPTKKEKKDSKKDLKIFMEALAKDPFKLPTNIMKDIGFSGSKGTSVKKMAIEEEYVKEHKINLGKLGSRGKYLEITEQGYQFLDALIIDFEKPKGRGNFETKKYQSIIAEDAEKKGFTATLECKSDLDDSYTLVDVSVVSKDCRIAYEVEMDVADYILENISKDIEAGYDKVVVVTKKDLKGKISKLIEKNISDEFKEMVEVRAIAEFIN